jgi:UDP-GlcNAc:undecaprenyl-phosphate GlcNAc-1-phosphate transferase
MLFLSTLLISMFTTMALIPILRTAALRLKAGLDVPDARKVHARPVPKVGGVAMAVGALIPLLFVADGGRFANALLIGAWIIVCFGVVDDLKNLGWKAKFAGQVAAALVVILYGGVEICFLGTCLPEGVGLSRVIGLPLTVIVIVGVTNAINLSDGLDGLAGGTSLLIFVCIAALGYASQDFAERLFVMVLCTAVAGAIIGFLRFNTYPATVFMGDAGSQMLGFLAVTLALGLTQRSATLAPLMPLLLLGFPVLDTLTVMAERITAGRSPFSPDKNHFHHKLMRLGLFHSEAVVVIYALIGLLAAAAYLLRFHSDLLLLGCYALFCAGVIAAFTAAERRGFRFHRTGFFDLRVKGRLKSIKDRRLPIRIIFPVLQYGLPLLFAAACLVPQAVPGFLAVTAAGLAAAIACTWLMRPQWRDAVMRLALYLTAPVLSGLGQLAPAAWIEPAVLRVYGFAYGILALVTVLTLRLTWRKQGFKTTPMDFLILMIALVVPNLPEPVLGGAHLGEVAVKLITLFFGFEVLAGELRGRSGGLAAMLIAALTVLAARSVF